LISDVSVEIATSDALPIERIGAIVSVFVRAGERRFISARARHAAGAHAMPALATQQEDTP